MIIKAVFGIATGYRKAVADLTVNDCPSADYHLMTEVKAEMDQFRDGLSTFGFSDMMKTIRKPFFIYSSSDMTELVFQLL